MALQIDISDIYGTGFEQAYLRVTSYGAFSGLGYTQVNLLLSIHTNKESRDAKKKALIENIEVFVPQESYELYFGVDELSKKDNNPFKQAYKFLKTLDNKTKPKDKKILKHIELDLTKSIDIID